MQRTAAAPRAAPSDAELDHRDAASDPKRTRNDAGTDSWVQVGPGGDESLITAEEIDAATAVLVESCGPAAAGAASSGLWQASHPPSPGGSGLLDLSDAAPDASQTRTDTSADVDVPTASGWAGAADALDRPAPISDGTGAASDVATDGLVEELSPGDALAPVAAGAGVPSGAAAAAAGGLAPAEAQALGAAVQMMQSDPELRKVVRSLAMDPNIHNAVRQNQAVQDFARRQAAAGRALEGGAFAGGRGPGVGGGEGARLPGPLHSIIFGQEPRGPMGWVLRHVQGLLGHLAMALDDLFAHLNHHANAACEKVTGHPLDAAENEHLRTALVLAVTVVSVAIIRRPLLRPFVPPV